MKSLGIARKVDDLGRIVLPIELRRQFGIESGDALDISVDPDTKSIVLHRSENGCVFCGSTERTRTHHDRLVCGGCINELNPRPTN